MCLDTRMILTSIYSVSAGHAGCLQFRLKFINQLFPCNSLLSMQSSSDMINRYRALMGPSCPVRLPSRPVMMF